MLGWRSIMTIPNHFCWTRFGTEAAQPIQQILKRKEQERQANEGVFYWGIGNAIGPSLRALLGKTASPEVLFSPIKSAPRSEDVAPSSVVAWTTGETLFGDFIPMPSTSLVTSRLDPQSPKSTHYALVCYRESSLTLGEESQEIEFSDLRNILTGRSVGASQVTCVVEHSLSRAGASKSYPISLRARLIDPFLIRLQDPLPIQMNSGVPLKDESWSEAVREIWDRRVSSRIEQLAFQGV